MEKTLNFVPSKYQKDIFNNYQNTNQNLSISAVPGSGKSTTLIQLLKFVPIFKKTIFLAFNKSIVEDLQKKVPKNINVSTLHSLGCKSIYKTYNGKVQISDYKTYKFAKALSKNWKSVPPKKIEKYIYNICQIINLYKLRLEKDYKDIMNIIMYYDIECIGNEAVDSVEVLEALNNYNENPFAHDEKFMIDFSDMVYLPCVQSKIRLDQYDEVFIDESQDLNKAQQVLVKKIIKSTGRFISVGDPRQSIYGFMSADINAYEDFKNQKNTVELPLSFCYRCGTEIVKLANNIYPVIESPDNMFEGEVESNSKLEDIKEGDFVLCRNNAPLVELYFYFIDSEKKCYIKGSEIGDQIIKLLEDRKNLQKSELLQDLEKRLIDIYEDLKNKGIQEPTKHPRYGKLAEKISIIKIIAKKYNSTAQMINISQKIFTDSGSGIALMSMHKSKGLENDCVYILDISLLPSSYSTQEWQKVQERNLEYVAYTRAKKKLGFVTSSQIK